MTLELAQRLGRALDVRSQSRVRVIDEAIKQYVRLTAQSPTVPMTGTIDAAQVVSGTFDDGRIGESAVTQHEAALQIDASMQLVNETPVAQGGTGRSTLTSAALLVGAGTGPVNVLAPGTAGFVVRSTGSGWAAAQLGFTDLSGSVGTAQVPEAAVTQHESALEIDWMQLAGVPDLAVTDAQNTFGADQIIATAAGVSAALRVRGNGHVGGLIVQDGSDGNVYIWKVEAGFMSFAVGNVEGSRVVPPASGGLLANNLATGGGLERVLTTGDLANTQTTVGGAGGASALPATPTGYISVGGGRVIPFYDAS